MADTSVLVALAFEEPDWETYFETMARSAPVLVSAVSVVEARMVIRGRRGETGILMLNDILRSMTFEIVPVGSDEADAAYGAFAMYGKGGGHPANLNFGDLFSYALAKTRRLPLLYKGENFGRTDIESALAG